MPWGISRRRVHTSLATQIGILAQTGRAAAVSFVVAACTMAPGCVRIDPANREGLQVLPDADLPLSNPFEQPEPAGPDLLRHAARTHYFGPNSRSQTAAILIRCISFPNRQINRLCQGVWECCFTLACDLGNFVGSRSPLFSTQMPFGCHAQKADYCRLSDKWRTLDFVQFVHQR